MPHYVFLDDRDRVIGIAVNTTREDADLIAADLTDKREFEEGYLPDSAMVTAREIKAYDSRPVKVGDRVSGAVANALPEGSAVVCIGTNHVTTSRMPWALLRGDAGYIQPDHTEEPLDPTARFEVLHIGGAS